MGRTGEPSGRIACVLVVLLAAHCGGGGGKDDAGEDTSPDLDAVEEEVADTVEDEAPATCEGTETLNLVFLDRDDEPIEGIEVAVDCLGERLEGTSGTDGTVSFENMDLTGHTLDITYVDDAWAASILGLGGSRTIPDPVTLYSYAPAPMMELQQVSGDIVRNDPESYVMFHMSMGRWVSRYVARYNLLTAISGGTDQPLSVFEYTSDGETVDSILGYSFSRFDTPDPGVDGPVVSASTSATIHTGILEVVFDIRPGSPLEDIQIPTDTGINGSSRVLYGAQLYVLDALGPDGYLGGFTTSWTRGETSDSVGYAWAQEAVDSGDSYYSILYVHNTAETCYTNRRLPADPSTWDTVILPDVAEIPGLATHTSSPFDTPIEVEVPDLAGFYESACYILHSGLSWEVYVHPEVTSFSFSDLPWPSSVDLPDLLGPSIIQLRVEPWIVYFTEDPFIDAARFTDKGIFFASPIREPRIIAWTSDGRYLIDHPL